MCDVWDGGRFGVIGTLVNYYKRIQPSDALVLSRPVHGLAQTLNAQLREEYLASHMHKE